MAILAQTNAAARVVPIRERWNEEDLHTGGPVRSGRMISETGLRFLSTRRIS